MSIEEKLDAMRTVAEGCSLAAFGDRQTRLVLRVSSDKPWAQEKLDDLCSQGADCFELADSEAVVEKFGVAEEGAGSAILLNARDVRLFFRSQTDDADMICGVFRSSDGMADVSEAAQTLISEL